MNSEHERILTAALRAPSAHNAQPWRIRERDDVYELHYDHHDYLPADPDDRDAYLCMGAFCETLAIAASGEQLCAQITPVLTRSGSDLHVADVRFERALSLDPLAVDLAKRATNRASYYPDPLPDDLAVALEDLGCTLVPTQAVTRLVRRASELSWRDEQFVGDLETWLHDDGSRPDGMSTGQLGLHRYEWHALRLAFRLGSLPAPAARVYSSRDLRLLGDAPAVAVLGAVSDSPAELLAAGRRLLRAWVTICGSGFGYHPISIAIDRQETRPGVAVLLPRGETPVAMFRIGRPTEPARPSNRVRLADVLRHD